MSLSFIIATKNTAPVIRKALQAALAQAGSEDELIVADASTDETPKIVHTEFPQVRLLRHEPSTLVPELWTAGINAAEKDLVAITIGNCVLQPGWRSAVDKSIGQYAAVGGAIETSSSASILATAVYLCRYWRYSLPFQSHETSDLPGDNSVYNLTLLRQYEPLYEKGFIEPFIHAKMVQDGHKLLMNPEMAVVHEHPFATGPFLKNRFLHGLSFGTEYSRKLSRGARAARVVMSPAVPFILMSRILPRGFQSRGSGLKIVLSLPLLFLFLSAWGAGECVAYLKALSRT